MNTDNQTKTLERKIDNAILKLPPKDPISFEFYKMQKENEWSITEINFGADKKDFAELTPGKKSGLEDILCFFLPADGLVNNNILFRFVKDVTDIEDVMSLIAQMSAETVHMHTYTSILYNLYSEQEMKRLYKKAAEMDTIKLKAEFMVKYTESDNSFVERLYAFALAEGLFFAVLFAIIFYFRTENVLPALIQANEFIAKDETVHRNYSCYLFRKYGGMSLDKVMKMTEEAIGIEDKFIDGLDLTEFKGLDKESLKDFVRLIADHILVECDFEPQYNTECNIKYLNDISLYQHHNFFEVKGSNYTIGTEEDYDNNNYDPWEFLTADF